MTMAANGLAKLIEECGEVTQIAAKKLACPNTDEHWDGGGSLKMRLEDELADIDAARLLVIETHGLDASRIAERTAKKLALFREWHADPNA